MRGHHSLRTAHTTLIDWVVWLRQSIGVLFTTLFRIISLALLDHVDYANNLGCTLSVLAYKTISHFPRCIL